MSRKVQDLPGLKGSRRPAGGPLREHWKNHTKGGKQMNTAFGQCVRLPPKGTVAVSLYRKVGETK